VAPYEAALRKAIHAYKYRGRWIFSRPFAAILQSRAPWGCDALAWVPASSEGLRERGQDHLEPLAMRLGSALSLPLVRALARSRTARRQASLKRKERLKNAKGAYVARAGAALKGAKIILIDDVLTTGATLRACATALKAAGVREVHALVLARD
jgi:ComF family protein